jgi:hypothetical protein
LISGPTGAAEATSRRTGWRGRFRRRASQQPCGPPDCCAPCEPGPPMARPPLSPAVVSDSRKCRPTGNLRLPDATRQGREDWLQSAIPSASSTRVSSTREWIPSLR